MECGQVCNSYTCQDLAFFRRQVVKSKAEFLRRTINKKNETDQLIKSQTERKKTTKVYRRFIAAIRERSTGKIQKFPTALPFPCFRLVCTGRTCITPVTTTPFWFRQVSLTWVFLPLARWTRKRGGILTWVKRDQIKMIDLDRFIRILAFETAMQQN